MSVLVHCFEQSFLGQMTRALSSGDVAGTLLKEQGHSCERCRRLTLRPPATVLSSVCFITVATWHLPKFRLSCCCHLLFLNDLKFCLTVYAGCRGHLLDCVAQNNQCCVRKCFCAELSVGRNWLVRIPRETRAARRDLKPSGVLQWGGLFLSLLAIEYLLSGTLTCTLGSSGTQFGKH